MPEETTSITACSRSSGPAGPRTWDEQVAPRNRAGDPAPEPRAIYAAARRGGVSGCAYPRGPGVDPPLPRRARHRRRSGSSIYPAVQNMRAARAVGLGATLTTLHLVFEKEAEAALGLPPNVHSYALLPIGYPMGRFGPVRRVPLADVVYEDRWGHPCRDL